MTEQHYKLTRALQRSTDIYIPPTKAEHMFFSNACGTFDKIHTMLGYKSNLSKLNRIDII